MTDKTSFKSRGHLVFNERCLSKDASLLHTPKEHARKPHCVYKVASRGGAISAFHHVGHVNPPSCEPNSCFSIRRILDLPEQSVDERSYCSSNSPLGESCTVSVPAVLPRKVLPMVSHHGDNVSCRGLINWQQFPLAAYSHWSYGPISLNNQGFPLDRIFQKKKQRPLFSPHQIQTMENEFLKKRYVTEDKRAQLALELNLTETQVKTSGRCSQGEMKHVLAAMQSKLSPFYQNINICVDSLVTPLGVLPQHYAEPMFHLLPNLKVRFLDR